MHVALLHAIALLDRQGRDLACHLRTDHDLHHRLDAAVGDDQAVAGHGAHQMVELGFDRRQVGKDVGVVVFEVVEDRRARPVVDELAALVEEGGVVLVGLDDEVPTLPEARA